MNIIDIITKKRNGGELSNDELEFVVNSDIPDYQLSALLMAIFLKGMTDMETIGLTYWLAKSGKQFDFTDDSTFIDLHSTGGVGDKCTLIVAPIVAACGAKVAKLAGRGLGHTGGTVDKLESFPDFSCNLSPEQFENQARTIGIAIGAQTDEITPKDGELYHLRDVTGTVESLPLIASSIMSKKLATGCPNIVLDVTYGSGAFMKTKKDARKLAALMKKIGNMHERKTVAVITPMSEPLGNCIGNILEVEEAISYLSNGKFPSLGGVDAEGGRGGSLPDKNLQKICTLLAVNMLELALSMNPIEALKSVQEVVQNGKALEKFQQMVEAQGGKWTASFPQSKIIEKQTLEDLDAYKIGDLVRSLGGGRLKKDDKIDLTVGVKILNRTTKEVEIHKN